MNVFVLGVHTYAIFSLLRKEGLEGLTGMLCIDGFPNFAGKAVSSLVQTTVPLVTDADTDGSWEDAGEAAKGAKGDDASFFDTADIPLRQEQQGVEIDCSSLQNSPCSNSSVQDMSIDEFD